MLKSRVEWNEAVVLHRSIITMKISQPTYTIYGSAWHGTHGKSIHQKQQEFAPRNDILTNKTNPLQRTFTREWSSLKHEHYPFALHIFVLSDPHIIPHDSQVEQICPLHCWNVDWNWFLFSKVLDYGVYWHMINWLTLLFLSFIILLHLHVFLALAKLAMIGPVIDCFLLGNKKYFHVI
jgi:hypothetical protein